MFADNVGHQVVGLRPLDGERTDVRFENPDIETASVGNAFDPQVYV